MTKYGKKVSKKKFLRRKRNPQKGARLPAFKRLIDFAILDT